MVFLVKMNSYPPTSLTGFTVR